MSLPGIQVILSGMSTLDQIKDNVATFDKPALTDEEVKFLLDVCEKFHSSVAIPCTACRYCTPNCPMGIDIPAVLAIFNKVKIDNARNAKDEIAKLEAGPDDCIGCRACTIECPQSIQIPDLMEEFKEKLAAM